MSSRAAAGRKRLQTPHDLSLSTSKTFLKSSRIGPAINSSSETFTQQDADLRAEYNQLSPYTGYQIGPTQDSSPRFKKSAGQSPHSLPTVNQTFSRTPPISSNSNVFQNTMPLGSHDHFNRYPPSPQLSASPSRTESQPPLQRAPLRPQSRPIPQSYEVQQGSYFVGHSSPASHSVESFPISRSPNIPYREMSSAADHSATSSVSGTPTATSFNSFQSYESEYTANTVSTSPPTSYSHLAPSPSSSTATVDNATLYQYRRDSTSSGSPSSGRDSQASMRMNHPQYYGSSSSSSGSQRGASSDTASSFVFPSSRSRAVPSSPPRFRFKSKKKKDQERAIAEPQLGPAGPSILVGGETHPSSSFPGASISFAEPPPLSPKVTSPTSSTRSPTHTTSSEGSQGFVYPSSRSRAHPDPSKKMKNPKVSSPTNVSPTSPSRFMGIPLKRKKKSNGVAPTIQEEPPELSPSHHTDPELTLPAELQSRLGLLSMSPHENRTAAIQRCTKVGTYPLDPYDSTLLECDRQTGELLRQLNSSGTPSFYPYGTNPPSMILDLGCGQGHWMLDAAITWKGYGTRVTGVDMVDIGKNLRGLATKHGVADNVSFVKTNFVNKQLPFPDETFDMVRMSCLTFAISFDKWHHVLQEVCRVLTVGGRLELIDDHFFFAYGKPPLSVPPSPSECFPPQLDIPIPSPRMSAIGPPPSIHVTVVNTGPRTPGGDDDSELYESDDAGPFNSRRHRNDTHLSTQSPVPSSVGTASMIQSLYPDSWTESAASSKELESLFEHMLNIRYGIHLCPSEFLVEMTQRIFGHAREMETMHLTLAPPYDLESDSNFSSRLSDPTALSLKDDPDPLLDSPGLILWPSTFLPMPQRQVEAHALKHNKVLLSTKLALVEYVLEISDEEDADDEGVKEALWDYENFLQQRFNPPSNGGIREDSASSVSDDDIDRATIGANADRVSVFSMSSVTTEGRTAMLEYQSDLRNRFGWAAGEPSSTNSPTSSASHQTARPTATDMGAVAPQLERSPTIKSMPPSFQSRRESRLSATTSMANPPPTYSRFEPAHVRTFHVYEAFKMKKPSKGEDAEW